MAGVAVRAGREGGHGNAGLGLGVSRGGVGSVVARWEVCRGAVGAGGEVAGGVGGGGGEEQGVAGCGGGEGGLGAFAAGGWGRVLV
jgi:hypothetical protein